METSFFSDEELKDLGFCSVGKNVKISRYARFYGIEKIKIGNNVRIDDYCILSGKIDLGNNIHIATYSAIFAGNTGVKLNDFVGLSARCIIYAESDDYSGEYLTNPTIDKEYLGVICGVVKLEKHVIIGTGTTILPGVCIEEGAAVGSMSLVNKSLEAWKIYAGIPCKYMKERKKDILELEQKYLSKYDKKMRGL